MSGQLEWGRVRTAHGTGLSAFVWESRTEVCLVTIEPTTDRKFSVALRDVEYAVIAEDYAYDRQQGRVIAERLLAQDQKRA
jgi:hypothetical protein